jgi:hypothetical protein
MLLLLPLVWPSHFDLHSWLRLHQLIIDEIKVDDYLTLTTLLMSHSKEDDHHAWNYSRCQCWPRLRFSVHAAYLRFFLLDQCLPFAGLFWPRLESVAFPLEAPLKWRRQAGEAFL